MKLLLSCGRLPPSMIGLLAVVIFRRSQLPRLGPAGVAHPTPFQFALTAPELWQVSHGTGFALA